MASDKAKNNNVFCTINSLFPVDFIYFLLVTMMPRVPLWALWRVIYLQALVPRAQ